MIDEKPWRDVYKRLVALDHGWEKPRFRAAAIDALRTLMQTRCAHVPHLGSLVRLLRPEMTRQDLCAFLGACERTLKKVKITDTEILATDKSPLASDAAPKMSLSVIADNFRSAVNVGTLFRVSECFALERVSLCGYTPAPEDGRAKASALGAEDWVPWERFTRTSDALEAYCNRGYHTIALETVEGATPLEAHAWQFPCALFLGSERFGLDADIVEACDTVIRIPMYGRKNSLNVVTAFSIAAHAARLAYNRLA